MRDDIAAKELRRRARREANGRVASRLLALANGLDGMDRGRGCAAGRDGPPDAPGLGYPVQRTGHRRSARPVALVPPTVGAAAMQAMLDELAQAVRPGAHAVVLMDRAGWPIAKDLTAPAKLTPLFLPPYSPELNALERVWLHLRERFLSHRLWPSRPTRISWMPVAPPGTRCSTRPAASAPSAPSTGPHRSVLNGTGIASQTNQPRSDQSRIHDRDKGFGQRLEAGHCCPA
jgi:DDE superfamily endonuclease